LIITAQNIGRAVEHNFNGREIVAPKHPPAPPMTLGNMREQGVYHA
jgi:hypothetical protein